ncbi:helix-turn-helix transcriptional regulator [Gracilibacillus sp. YIM 98692]|uniref:helix-turn-helix transcriptional regulator n=1 Tax=Gracilibacillus sp. YIM 98692 TaxID=2663532 RepID=UPI0013CFBD97|nr:helix-turn-helix transcriptional regulator [Gracilibacillus sp. YIM 98692]
MRNWLKEMRNQRRLTHFEVATLSGISRSHYTHIEKGNKTPSVEVAKSIAKTLKFDWVIFFENKSSQKEQIDKELIS